MKELGNNLAQLVAIIMVMITLAISTAALSQWVNSETSADGSSSSTVQQGETRAPSLSASVAP